MIAMIKTYHVHHFICVHLRFRQFYVQGISAGEVFVKKLWDTIRSGFETKKAGKKPNVKEK